MDAIEAIMTRRSIRSYTENPVSEADIETLLRAAMAAPSAKNQQPWRFVVTTERELIDRLADVSPFGGMLTKAPLAITVCGDLHDLERPGMWQQDCSAAVQNTLLAAHALGLGAVWIGIWPQPERVAPLKELLGLPEGVEPFCMLSIGHPSARREPADRFRPEFVRRERW